MLSIHETAILFFVKNILLSKKVKCIFFNVCIPFIDTVIILMIIKTQIIKFVYSDRCL